MRAVTGIEVIDKGLQGGFPCPSGILLFSETIAEKRIFAEQFIASGLRNGEVCLYLDFYRAPQFVRRDFRKFGDLPQENLLLVDTTSAQILVDSKEQYQARDLEDPSAILQVITDVLKERHPTRVVLDSLDFLTERFSRDVVIDFLRDLMRTASETPCVIGLLFLNWSYGKEELEKILEHTDYTLEFKTTLKGGVVLNKLRLSGHDPDGSATSWIPFSFKELLGLVLHFPRVLVTGPFHAGKSTVVQQLSETAVSVDRMGTTVAFDYGTVDVSGVDVDLLGTPGQERFEFIFKIFAREVNGILLVVDSTKPHELARAREMRKLAGEQVPLVILANKRDLHGVMPIKDIRAGLGLEEYIPIVETVATEDRGLKEALEKLVGIIIWGWSDV